jgi:hypothetical protein
MGLRRGRNLLAMIVEVSTKVTRMKSKSRWAGHL